MSCEQSYHGPHVVLSLSEIEWLRHKLYLSYLGGPVEDSVIAKLDAALKSHPDFLKPAK